MEVVGQEGLRDAGERSDVARGCPIEGPLREQVGGRSQNPIPSGIGRRARDPGNGAGGGLRHPNQTTQQNRLLTDN